MKINKRFIVLFLFLLLIGASSSPLITGSLMEAPLEKKLTDLFGMPVMIDHLQVDLIQGKVKASRIRFVNQPQFTPGPHLDVRGGIEVYINFFALRRKQVRISRIYLKKPGYFIESVPNGNGHDFVTNVRTWVRHIKQRNRESGEKNVPAAAEPETHWSVRIKRIILHDGTFRYYSHAGKRTRKNFLFRNLEGTLVNFHWPSDPTQFDQDVKLKGKLGRKFPAPFWIFGKANFATSDVGFDLKGEIPHGSLLDHQIFWKGLPLKLVDGTFRLKTQALCVRQHLQSNNLLILHDVKVTPSRNAKGLIWGIPSLASVRFLQSKKDIYLKVPVSGDISDPRFEFPKAFRKAFQNSLVQYVRSGFKIIQVPVRIVTKTGEAVMATPVKMVEKVGQISKAVGVGSLKILNKNRSDKEPSSKEVVQKQNNTV